MDAHIITMGASCCNHLAVIKVLMSITTLYRRTGPVTFRGGGGAEVSCPNIFSIAFPKIKWFCPNIACFFAQKWLFEKIIEGCSPQPPASYAYATLKQDMGLYRVFPKCRTVDSSILQSKSVASFGFIG